LDKQRKVPRHQGEKMNHNPEPKFKKKKTRALKAKS